MITVRINKIQATKARNRTNGRELSTVQTLSFLDFSSFTKKELISAYICIQKRIENTARWYRISDA